MGEGLSRRDVLRGLVGAAAALPFSRIPLRRKPWLELIVDGRSEDPQAYHRAAHLLARPYEATSSVGSRAGLEAVTEPDALLPGMRRVYTPGRADFTDWSMVNVVAIPKDTENGPVDVRFTYIPYDVGQEPKDPVTIAMTTSGAVYVPIPLSILFPQYVTIDGKPASDEGTLLVKAMTECELYVSGLNTRGAGIIYGTEGFDTVSRRALTGRHLLPLSLGVGNAWRTLFAATADGTDVQWQLLDENKHPVGRPYTRSLLATGQGGSIRLQDLLSSDGFEKEMVSFNDFLEIQVLSGGIVGQQRYLVDERLSDVPLSPPVAATQGYAANFLGLKPNWRQQLQVTNASSKNMTAVARLYPSGWTAEAEAELALDLPPGTTSHQIFKGYEAAYLRRLVVESKAPLSASVTGSVPLNPTTMAKRVARARKRGYAGR